jgi:hypothetical protein
LEWPLVSAGVGVVCLASRIAYAQGYYTAGMLKVLALNSSNKLPYILNNVRDTTVPY